MNCSIVKLFSKSERAPRCFSMLLSLFYHKGHGREGIENVDAFSSSVRFRKGKAGLWGFPFCCPEIPRDSRATAIYKCITHTKTVQLRLNFEIIFREVKKKFGLCLE